MNDLLSILIDSGYLQQQFDAHPRDMWAYTALVFALGVAIGYAAARRSSKRELKEQRGRYGELEARLAAERERFEADGDEHRSYYESEMEKRNKETKRLQNLLDAEKTLSSSYKEKLVRSEERLRHYEDKEAEEEARERTREDRRCVAFREGMPFRGKKLLASLMYGGPRDVPGADSKAMREYFGDEAYSHVIVEEVGDDVVRVSLHDGSREFFERHPDLLEDARKALPQES